MGSNYGTSETLVQILVVQLPSSSAYAETIHHIEHYHAQLMQPLHFALMQLLGFALVVEQALQWMFVLLLAALLSVLATWAVLELEELHGSFEVPAVHLGACESQLSMHLAALFLESICPFFSAVHVHQKRWPQMEECNMSNATANENDLQIFFCCVYLVVREFHGIFHQTRIPAYQNLQQSF